MPKKRKTKGKAGPKPDILKIEGENCEDALKTAIQKEKPKEGWPKKPKNKS